MNEFFFQLSGSAESYWAYNQPWPQIFSFMYSLVKPYLPLLFLQHHPLCKWLILWPKCKYLFVLSRPLQALTLSLYMPATLPTFCLPQMWSAIIHVPIQVPDSNEDTEPRGLPQQIALQFDTNPLISTLLSHFISQVQVHLITTLRANFSPACL